MTVMTASNDSERYPLSGILRVVSCERYFMGSYHYSVMTASNDSERHPASGILLLLAH